MEMFIDDDKVHHLTISISYNHHHPLDDDLMQVTIHTDTLNESCCVEGTLAAVRGRAIHTYHSEGAGGGHAPDIITVCSQPNIIPS